MPALHGASDAARLVAKGSAVLALHLRGREEEEVSESAQIPGEQEDRFMDVEHRLWRMDRYMRLAMCQEIDDCLVFPKAQVS